MTNWADYLMGFALHAASKSRDSTKVGAILVGPDGEVRLTAYNGPPRGVLDLPERFEHPVKYLYCSHAEENLIAFAAREGIRTKGCTVYTTLHPCSRCARTLIQAGISCVVIGDGETKMPVVEFQVAARMFEEAGVERRTVDDGSLPRIPGVHEGRSSHDNMDSVGEARYESSV